MENLLELSIQTSESSSLRMPGHMRSWKLIRLSQRIFISHPVHAAILNSIKYVVHARGMVASGYLRSSS